MNTDRSRPAADSADDVVSTPMAATAASFFTIGPDPNVAGGEWLRPTDPCRGPWDPDACHAGPPTGMLIRAAERLLPDQRFVRITVGTDEQADRLLNLSAELYR